MSRVLINSGIEWIGKIPESWKIIPNKRIMFKIKEICNEYTNQDILSLTMNGIVKRDIENPTGKMPESFDGYQYVYKDNLVMCLFDMDVTPRCIGLSNYDGLISPAYTQFKLYNKNYNRFYYYYYLYLDNTKELLHLSKNLRSSITDSQLGEIHIPVPTEKEAIRIANYLDKKCSKIDKTIKDNNKAIELLEEYKNNSILNMVTSGVKNKLDKDSNIDWIGKVPNNWEVLRGKYIFTIPMNSYNFVKDSSNIANLVRVEHLNNKLGLFEIEESFDKVNVNITAEQIKPPMILTPKRGGAIYTNKIRIVNSECLLDPNVMAIKTDENIKYYSYVLFARKLSNIADINTIPQLNNKHINNQKFPKPPLEEQKEIAKYLDDFCAKIDKVIMYRKQIIEKLEEYKKSLIYEVVTGKKEV